MRNRGASEGESRGPLDHQLHEAGERPERSPHGPIEGADQPAQIDFNILGPFAGELSGRRPHALHQSRILATLFRNGFFSIGSCDCRPRWSSLTTLLAARSAQATDYYVATTGSDSNAGTMASPFATLQKGVNTAVAGDTVYIRGGTYSITTPATSGAGINFTKSGTATSPINYFAYQGEVPVFDFTNMVISTTGYTHGFVINASYLHFKGLEIRYVPMNTFSNNGVAVTGGGYDIFELLNMHHNSGNGIFIGSKTAGGHQILNCDAHDNYDATSSQGQGQNADGFGVHYQTTGDTTTHPGLPLVVELRRRLRFDQPGGPRHRRELLGVRQRVRHVRHLQPGRRKRERLQDGEQRRPASATWSRTTSPGRTRRRGSTPTIRPAGTPGTTTRRS